MTLSIDPLSEAMDVSTAEIDIVQEAGMLSDEQLARRAASVRSSIVPHIPSSSSSIEAPVSREVRDLSVERAAASAGIRPSPETMDIDPVVAEVPMEIDIEDIGDRMDVEELDVLKQNLAEDIKKLDRLQKNLEAKVEEETRLGNPARGSYLLQISKLVAEISTMLNNWNNRDSHRTEKTKKEYRKNSDAIQESSYRKASAAAICAVGGFAVQFLVTQFYSPDAGGTVAGLTQSFKEIWQSYVDTPKEQQTNQLLLQEIQKLGESSGSNNDLAEKARRILDEVKQWLEKAIARG